MNRDHENDLIDLGAVTAETKGGPMGFEDAEGTLWLNDFGLTQD
jgi:hypothetical protein